MDFFLNGKTVSWQEAALIFATSGFPPGASDVLSRMKKTFAGRLTYGGVPVRVVFLGVSEGRPVVQLLLPLRLPFDDGGCGRWSESSVREYLNSRCFFNKLKGNLVKHIRPFKVRTGHAVTEDMFWLLSADEVGYKGGIYPSFVSEGEKAFDAFGGESSRIRDKASWWLRTPMYDSDFTRRAAFVTCEGGLYSSISTVKFDCFPACALEAK